jgi:hypothetical protein
VLRCNMVIQPHLHLIQFNQLIKRIAISGCSVESISIKHVELFTAW